jgi:hypothetical protein
MDDPTQGGDRELQTSSQVYEGEQKVKKKRTRLSKIRRKRNQYFSEMPASSFGHGYQPGRFQQF